MDDLITGCRGVGGGDGVGTGGEVVVGRMR